MSRTYRKSRTTDRKTLVKHINDFISYYKRRNYYYEYYLTDHGQKAYDKAVEEWETAYGFWINGKYKKFGFNSMPVGPDIWDFKKARVVYKNINFNEVVTEAIDEYNKCKRDGRFYDGDISRSFRKNGTKELRVHNRRLARQIIKDDDYWEDKPYPDTYLGKKHIWDYF